MAPTPTVKVGDVIPQGTFSTIDLTAELETDKLACGIPYSVNTDEWKGKKVVVFAVPGAFTPTCHANHLPPYLDNYEKFKAKGVDIIAVVAVNDVYVMSGWARFEGLGDKIVTLTDTNAEWSRKLGLTLDLSAHGLGERTARYALIINDLKIEYIDVEPAGDVTVSGAEHVLSKL